MICSQRSRTASCLLLLTSILYTGCDTTAPVGGSWIASRGWSPHPAETLIVSVPFAHREVVNTPVAPSPGMGPRAAGRLLGFEGSVLAWFRPLDSTRLTGGTVRDTGTWSLRLRGDTALAAEAGACSTVDLRLTWWSLDDSATALAVLLGHALPPEPVAPPVELHVSTCNSIIDIEPPAPIREILAAHQNVLLRLGPGLREGLLRLDSIRPAVLLRRRDTLVDTLRTGRVSPHGTQLAGHVLHAFAAPGFQSAVQGGRNNLPAGVLRVRFAHGALREAVARARPDWADALRGPRGRMEFAVLSAVWMLPFDSVRTEFDSAHTLRLRSTVESDTLVQWVRLGPTGSAVVREGQEGLDPVQLTAVDLGGGSRSITLRVPSSGRFLDSIAIPADASVVAREIAGSSFVVRKDGDTLSVRSAWLVQGGVEEAQTDSSGAFRTASSVGIGSRQAELLMRTAASRMLLGSQGSTSIEVFPRAVRRRASTQSSGWSLVSAHPSDADSARLRLVLRRTALGEIRP